MLTEEEIRRIARRKKMSVGLTDKEYVIEWLLKGIYESKIKDHLIFKGGTAIQKVYFPKTWRFSHDLDFTALYPDINIKTQFKEIFNDIEESSSVKLEFKSFHETSGSIIADVQFLGPLNARNRIRLDISLDENIITEPVLIEMGSQYPDIGRYKVRVYSLEEIVVEKIRSILQRGKSRDYYDVWMLLKVENFDLKDIRRLLIIKCESKGIEFKTEQIFDESKLDEAKGFWEVGLKDLVRELPDFDLVIGELRHVLRDL
ncbi:MAG: nucleotidyl transferase AbiEii/AbiGii toxin family protein [Methanosarcinales archaeon]|nr:nucleotidyl transferase AbiEii/AbiGii toxin family protein [Methanosarcinales archaeon]